ncbi:organic cation transporter protein-like isoform X2 [Littorina saxatilis]|uniref:organic cation transporter protein-like isoform X2 n=1 Tax=Littorina saxatilis TaxID=31220 RepID=UPI0038B4B9EF
MRKQMSSQDVEEVLDRLGGYGRYQVLLYIAMGLVNMRGALHVFVSMFVGWAPTHHCKPLGNHTLNQSLPWEENNYGEMAWSQCSMYREPGSGSVAHGNETVACQNGWTYQMDRDGETSIVSDWNLVCDDNYLSELAVTMYMVGATCGTLFLTPVSDRWGRKSVMLACLWLQAVIGVAVAFSPSPVVFVVLQFFIGICNMTIALCAYVLVVETFDKDTRELPALSLQFFWAGGVMLLALLAYLIPDWRHLELAVSLPQVLTISFIWLLPESLTWLLVMGKVKRARETILTIIRVNKLPSFQDLDGTMDKFKDGLRTQSEDELHEKNDTGGSVIGSKEKIVPKSSEKVAHTVLDVFKTPRVCRYAVLMFYLYLVNSLAYFGIAFFTPLLSGDKYINTLISGAVEVPAYIVCIITNRKIGRRWPICGFLLICAAANFVVIFLPKTTDDGTDLSTVNTALVMVGKFGITGSYSALYLYGSEIFPTSIRNHAVGLCSFFENIGSIAAPQIVYAAKTSTQLPMSVFAAMTAVGAIVVLFLPETHNVSLPQTLDEVEHWGKKPQTNHMPAVKHNDDAPVYCLSYRGTES